MSGSKDLSVESGYEQGDTGSKFDVIWDSRET